jgi:hypothetical protein
MNKMIFTLLICSACFTAYSQNATATKTAPVGSNTPQPTSIDPTQKITNSKVTQQNQAEAEKKVETNGEVAPANQQNQMAPTNIQTIEPARTSTVFKSGGTVTPPAEMKMMKAEPNVKPTPSTPSPK